MTPRIFKRGLLVGVCAAALLTLTIANVTAGSVTLDTLQIAFIGRESGKGAEVDRQFYQAAVTAADQINAGDDDDEEGVRVSSGDRYRLDIVYYAADTVDNAVSALDDAVDEDSIAVLGLYNNDQANAIQDAGTQDLPVLLGASDSPDGDTLYRLTANLEDRAVAAADYLVNERHFTRIAVLAANTSEAIDGTETFKTEAGSTNLVADIVREADEDDFSADVQTLRDEDAEALFVWVLDSQMIQLLSELQGSGWSGEIIYAGLDADFIASAGVDAAAQLYGFANWTSAAYDAASQAFVADYQAQWGITPPDAAASYYDAVYLLADAIEANGIQPASIRSWLTTTGSLTGVQGEYANAATDTLRLVQVQSDGSLVEVARYAETVCQTCVDTLWADTSSETATASETFRIGLIATLDGASETTGDQIEQAARLAVREINEAGGVLDANGKRYTLDLVTYSAETGDAAGTAFQQAVDDGVQLVIGPDYNAQVIPNLFRADNAEKIQLVSAMSDQVTVNGGSYVYQIRAADSVLASSSAAYLLEVRELTRFASVAVRTDYGLDSAEAFNDVVNASDEGEVVLELEHDVDAADFATLADQIVAANVEVVSVWSSQPAASALIAELQARNWQGVLVYGYLTSDFLATLGDSSFEMIAPVNWWTDAGDWASRDFTERYTARYGEAPIAQAAAYYDAIYLIATGLDSSGTSDLQTWLNGVDAFIGVQGTYSPDTFDTGELTREVVILSVQQGAVHTAARYTDGVCRIGCDG